jgi:hypothetical protein
MFVFHESTRARIIRRFCGTNFRLAAFVLLAAALTCSWWSVHHAMAQGNPAQMSLNLLGDPLKLQLKEGEAKIPVGVTVRNSSDRKVDLKFSAEVRDSERVTHTIKIPNDTSVEAYSVRQVDLDIASDELEDLSMPLKGFLIVSDEEGNVAPGTLPITLSKPKVLPAEIFGISLGVSWLILVIGFPGVVALIAVIVASLGVIWNTAKHMIGRGDLEKPHLFSTLGTVLTLKFGEGGSWASIIAVVAAVLQAFTTAAIYPEERAYFSAQQMAGFILTFAVLIGFAPVLYNLVRRKQKKVLDDTKTPAKPQPKDPPPVLSEPQRQGYVLTLLMSSALVVWALSGQLLVVGILITQIESTNMAFEVKVLLSLILAFSAVYALVYAVTSIRSALEKKSKKLSKKKEELKGRAGDDADELKRLAREYSTLERKQSLM